MIDVVYKGWNPGKLVKYLFGPGHHNEHENPRLVGVWDGRVDAWQPEHVGPGEFDFDLVPLIAALQAPLKLGGLPVTHPDPNHPPHRRFFKTMPDGTRKLRDGTVRHLVLNNAPGDRVLSDQEWRDIAEEMVHQAGWSRRDDPEGPRWIAVRHNDDGIHIAAVMVRQDNGKRVWPHNDYFKLRKTAKQMERRYGITITLGADRTASRTATRRSEHEKAKRQGRVPARDELRAVVAVAAAMSLDEHQFAQVLQRAGYQVEITRLPSGDLRGGKVARPDDLNAAGTPIWYSLSRLSPDLSIRKLAWRWKQARRGQRTIGALPAPGDKAARQAWLHRAVAAVEQACATVREDPSQVDGIAHAAGDLFAVLDHHKGRLLDGASARWDRASRAPHTPVPRAEQLANELRWLALGIGWTGGGGSAALELAAALAALGLQIAAIFQDQGRIHQARAARQAARLAGAPHQPVPASSPAGVAAAPAKPAVSPSPIRRDAGTPPQATREVERRK